MPGTGGASVTEGPPRTPLVIEGYRIDREIGAGGMATVSLAEDLKHHRPVAVKVIKPEMSAAIGPDRFLREIEVTARLNHPNVLPLFDSGVCGEHLYYVMPYVPGGSLRSRLVREGQLPVDEALRLARDVAGALAHAHQHGIVHRDIKPENILLNEGVALVADFGIARALTADPITDADRTMSATAPGAVMGTPQYMSPEQACGGTVDARADIYSLGCVLYEMLAGEPPFVAATPDVLVRMHLTSTPLPISDRRPGVPRAVAHVVTRCLAKLPEDRFATAVLLAEALLRADSTLSLTPSPGAAAAIPNNLPRERRHFIGREKELADCARLLSDTRLLTITGIGGCGKTRLALRLAERVLPQFPDGVWRVDLAPLTDASRVTETVAAALGVRQTADEDPLLTLLAGVARKQILVVLDNCEHLLAASAEIADALLRASDGIRIVVTSREGLGIDGERLFALRSLMVPPVEAAGDLHELLAVESVQLFLDCAHLAVRDFVLTAGNAAAVAEICRRLDGIPLAIELAAARVRMLSVEQIRAKLDDRFRLLTGGSRTAMPRHQTLRAALQWSYDQLPPAEQRLFRVLSVFARGWTLEHAALVADDSADEFEVLELLGRLIDKSLVVLNRERPDAPRYGLLETVRQYSAERLSEAGESDAARQRHAAAFLALAERAYTERFVNDEHWAAVLEREHDNLRAALELLRDSDAERYLQLAGSLGWYWQERSRLREGRDHLTRALANSAPDPPRRSRARALWAAAHLSAWQGEAVKGLPWMHEAVRLWRELGDLREVALALEGIGWMQLLSGDDEAARATFEECLRVQRELGDPVLVNRAMVALAQVLVALSRVDEARPMASEIVAFSSARGDRRNEHFGWHYLADCALIEGNCLESLRLYRQSLVLAQAVGDRLETAFEVQGIAMSLAGLGRPEQALRLAAAADAEWKRIGADVKVRFWSALLNRYLGPARVALSERAPRCESEGRLMAFDDAVAAALAESPAG